MSNLDSKLFGWKKSNENFKKLNLKKFYLRLYKDFIANSEAKKLSNEKVLLPSSHL